MQPKLSKKEKMVLIALGEVFKELRCENAMSQRMLAFEYGLHKSLISRFESSSNNPFFLNVWKIAETVDIRPSEFIALVEKKLPNGFKLID